RERQLLRAAEPLELELHDRLARVARIDGQRGDADAGDHREPHEARADHLAQLREARGALSELLEPSVGARLVERVRPHAAGPMVRAPAPIGQAPFGQAPAPRARSRYHAMVRARPSSRSTFARKPSRRSAFFTSGMRSSTSAKSHGTKRISLALPTRRTTSCASW